MAKAWTVDAESLEAVRKAMDNVEIQAFAVRGTEEIAKAVVEEAQSNLDQRAGGGKYTRAVAEVDTVEESDGWAAALFTPWLGMEFGGYITNVFSNRVGTGRAGTLGLEPMWAPWHSDVAQGYILGAAWSDMNQEKAVEALADLGLEAYEEAFDKEGVPEG